MQQQITKLQIPDDVVFSDLKLSRDSDGAVSFDWTPIDRICRANNLPIEVLRDGPEDNVSGLIVAWYMAHRANDGDIDPVAEDLIAETIIEDQSGQNYSHEPGTA